jgi:hypothetical protein
MDKQKGLLIIGLIGNSAVIKGECIGYAHHFFGRNFHLTNFFKKIGFTKKKNGK